MGVTGLSWWGMPKQETAATSRNRVAVELKVQSDFRFVAFGDTRFHDPSDTQPANATVRRALIAAMLWG